MTNNIDTLDALSVKWNKNPEPYIEGRPDPRTMLNNVKEGSTYLWNSANEDEKIVYDGELVEIRK